MRARGDKSRICPPYPQHDRKRRLNGAVSRNNRIKRLAPCRCLDGHVKEPYEMSMAWEPDRRSNFFFNPPAHLCAVTYITEISFHVTLNNQSHSLTLTSKTRRTLVYQHSGLVFYTESEKEQLRIPNLMIPGVLKESASPRSYCRCKF